MNVQFVLLCIIINNIYYVLSNDLSYDSRTCRNNGLANSTWPSDHGDSSRTKYAINAGLPKELNADDIKILKNNDLPKAQWLYTNGDNSELLYAMSASLSSSWVAKVDAVTLEVIDKVNIDNSLYIGGMLMHANGHVYAIHANTVYRFWNGDLQNMTLLRVPTRLNGKMVQSNGAIVTSDGYLLMRQWAVNMEDLVTMFGTASPPVTKAVFAFIIGCATIAVVLMPRKSSSMMAVLVTAFIGAMVGVMLTVALIIALLRSAYGEFDPLEFTFSNVVYRNKGGGGEIKLIDPIAMEVKAELFMEERCSFARSALSVLPNGENAIVLLGDEFVHQYRWNPTTEKLYEVEEWAERYRYRYTGTFPGTGPAIFDGVAYFTDNTFPVTLYGTSYTMFRKELEAVDGKEPSMKRVALTEKDKSGFMFWSVVVSPSTGDNGATDVIIWDSANHNVQVRRADDLSLRYNISSMQGDCITVAADRGHMYLSDYNKGPQLNAPDQWFHAIGPFGKNLYPELQKFLIVVDLPTGNVLANITVQEGGALGPSLIVPGANNDVFLGGSDGLMRVYVEKEQF